MGFRSVLWPGGVTLGAVLGWAYLLLKLLDSLGAAGAWLLSVNMVTFLTYGYDKAVAGSGRMRVPERLLLVLALVGGTPGALVGMWAFRHKTAKRRFRSRIALVAGLQIVAAGIYYFWIRPLIGR